MKTASDNSFASRIKTSGFGKAAHAFFVKHRYTIPVYPYVLWMALLVVAPIILVVIYAFTASDNSFTLENFSSVVGYAGIFGRSAYLAVIATVICLLIGYPVAYIISKLKPTTQKIVMMLIMLPMWINFLLRTYSWVSILENTGLINRFLGAIGFFKLWNNIFGTNIEYFSMINTNGAVVLGMVYNFLPFMIMPIHSVIVKIDRNVIEAAQDLGANSARVFRKIIFPLSMAGVISGITMVFVPCISTFVISKLLGGGTEILLGDLIEMQFLGSAYNPHLGAAISLIMMIIVMLCMAIMNRFGEGEEQAVML